MKKSMRIIAVILSVLMLSTCLSVGSFAHSFTDVREFDDAISTLTDIGVIRGESSTIFNPNSNIRRWQMALLLSKLLTGDTNDTRWESTSGKLAFEDVSNSTRHYGGSIDYATENGIIIGVSATEFAPDEGITLQDGVTMVVRALGYPRASYDAGYPQSYLTKGAQLGLLDGLSKVQSESVLTRGQTAQLLYNAYLAERFDGTTIEEDVFGMGGELVVLAADDTVSLGDRIQLADSGRLSFHRLNSDGTIERRALFTLKETEASAKLKCSMQFGSSYKVKMVNGEPVSAVKNGASVYTDKLVISEGTNPKVAINNVVYSLVSAYSYELKEGVLPRGTKELIVYGQSDLFDAYEVLTVKDMKNTNAVYTLTTFDDNGDGYADRAIYMPYSFGLYTVKNNTSTIKGSSDITFLTKNVEISGRTPSDGSYILYNYDEDAALLTVKSVLSKSTAYFSSYNNGKVVLYTSSVNNSKTYELGNDDLPGVDNTALESAVKAFTKGSSVQFITDGTAIYAFTTGTSGDNTVQPTGAPIISANVGIVGSVDTSGLSSTLFGTSTGVLKIQLYGSSTWMNVSMLNNTAVSALNRSIAKGDIIEFTAVDNLGSYNVNVLNEQRYAVDSSNSSSAFVNATTANGRTVVGVGYMTNLTARTYLAQVAADSTTSIVVFNGTSFATYSVASLAQGVSIPSGCAVYITASSASASAASLVYIRPKSITDGGNTPSGSKLVGNYAVVSSIDTTTLNSGYIRVTLAGSNGATNTLNVVAVNNAAVNSLNLGVAVGDLVGYAQSSYVPTNAPSWNYYYALSSASASLANTLTGYTYIRYVSSLASGYVEMQAYNSLMGGGQTTIGNIAVASNTPVISFDGSRFSTGTVNSLNSAYTGAYAIYAVYANTISNTPSYLYIRPYAANGGIAPDTKENVVSGYTVNGNGLYYVTAVNSTFSGVSVTLNPVLGGLSGTSVTVYSVDGSTSFTASSLSVGTIVSASMVGTSAALTRVTTGAYAAIRKESYLISYNGYYYLSPSQYIYGQALPTGAKQIAPSTASVVMNMGGTFYPGVVSNIPTGMVMYLFTNATGAVSTIYILPGDVSAASSPYNPTNPSNPSTPTSGDFTDIVWITGGGTQVSAGSDIYVYSGYSLSSGAKTEVYAFSSTARPTAAGYYKVKTEGSYTYYTFADNTPVTGTVSSSNGMLAFMASASVTVSASGVTIGTTTYNTTTSNIKVLTRSTAGLTESTLSGLTSGTYSVLYLMSNGVTSIRIIK